MERSGTFIVLLFWMNYSALVIMVGAVINATLEERKYGTIRSKRTLDHFNDSSVKRFLIGNIDLNKLNASC